MQWLRDAVGGAVSQLSSTETVLLIFPFVETNITNRGKGAILKIRSFISVFFFFSHQFTDQRAQNLLHIRNSAVAERPCDASCLSVVSFNNTTPWVHSSIISYFGFRFITVTPSSCRTTTGDRMFFVTAPHAWNTLPSSITASETLCTFKRHLNMHLFATSFP